MFNLSENMINNRIHKVSKRMIILERQASPKPSISDLRNLSLSPLKKKENLVTLFNKKKSINNLGVMHNNRFKEKMTQLYNDFTQVNSFKEKRGNVQNFTNFTHNRKISQNNSKFKSTMKSKLSVIETDPFFSRIGRTPQKYTDSTLFSAKIRKETVNFYDPYPQYKKSTRNESKFFNFPTNASTSTLTSSISQSTNNIRRKNEKLNFNHSPNPPNINRTKYHLMDYLNSSFPHQRKLLKK